MGAADTEATAVLKGRLGIEGGRIPHADRHGLLWLRRGNLYVESGTAHFATAGCDDLAAGDYALPFQMVSCLVLEPGTTVSHDVLRLCAAHGTGIIAVGEGGVRYYASMPFGPDESARARRQVVLWSNEATRVHVARQMYAWRMGEIFPSTDLNTLRGLEGVRVKDTYRRLAGQYGVAWNGRRYDRHKPDQDDIPNQALNHAATAVVACASVATAISGVIPQLGFIHESSGIAFALDIADLFRDSVTVPIAFSAVRDYEASRRKQRDAHGEPDSLERVVRTLAGRTIRKEQLVSTMVDRIKEILDGDDSSGDAKRS